MPADPSIYSQLRPAQPSQDPLQQYGALMQLRSMGDASQLHQLQFRKLNDDLAEEAAFKSKIADWAKTGGQAELSPDVWAASPTRAAALEKTRLEGVKTRGEIDKNRVEIHGKQVTQLRDELAAATDDAALARVRETATKLYGPNAAAGIPPSVSAPGFADWKKSQLMTADKMVESLTPKMEKVQIDDGGKITTQMIDVNPVTNPGVKNLNIVTQKVATPGELLTDERARKAQDMANWHYDQERGLLVNKVSGATKQAIGPDGKPLQLDPKLTESQGNATGFGLRAQTANDLLIGLENSGQFGKAVGAKQAVGKLPLVGGIAEAAGNTMLSEPAQRYEQAQRDFINAVLRKESGANINESEFDNARKQYFPQPGDADSVIEQKRKNRDTAIKSLTIQAGPGAAKIPAATVKPNAVGRDRQTLGGKRGVLTPNSDGSFNYGFGGG